MKPTSSSARIPALPALALALVALLAAPIQASGAQERTVSVEGTATQQVPNDTARLGFSVSEERKSRAAALQVVAVRLRHVIAAVQSVAGVGQGDVTTGTISLRKLSRDERTVYRASEGISVVLHQPDRAGELVSDAVAAGATGTRGPTFFPGDPDSAYDGVLAAAFDQAKARATVLAEQAGATLGPAIAIQEGAESFPAPVGAAQAAPAAKPSPPVKPGTSTVTATVHVVFALL